LGCTNNQGGFQKLDIGDIKMIVYSIVMVVYIVRVQFSKHS